MGYKEETVRLCMFGCNENYNVYSTNQFSIVNSYLVCLYSTATNREVGPGIEPLFTQQSHNIVQQETSGRIVGEVFFDTDTMEVEIGPTVPSDDPAQVPLEPQEDPPKDPNVELYGEPPAQQDIHVNPLQSRKTVNLCNQIMGIIKDYDINNRPTQPDVSDSHTHVDDVKSESQSEGNKGIDLDETVDPQQSDVQPDGQPDGQSDDTLMEVDQSDDKSGATVHVFFAHNHLLWRPGQAVKRVNGFDVCFFLFLMKYVRHVVTCVT